MAPERVSTLPTSGRPARGLPAPGAPRQPGDPAEREPLGTEVDGVTVLGALSPSRAGDFTSCALRYRFRTVDRLPEPVSAEAARGTLVHKVLERLFDLPAGDRTTDRARGLLGPAWAEILELEPELADVLTVVPDPVEDPGEGPGRATAAWLESAIPVLERYFTLEDPRRLEPAEREMYVETLLASKLLLRGVVDRLDVAADGRLRVVDYKTGSAPAVGFEGRALFQMKFYALVLWRTRGMLPTVLRLVYLGDGQILSYVPDEADLRATERKVEAIWAAIRAARETGDYRPNPGPACGWCRFSALCPAYGGTPPPLPDPLPSDDLAPDVSPEPAAPGAPAP